MTNRFRLPAVAAAMGVAGLAIAAAPATAAPLKIGMISTYSGPYADYGHQMDAGMKIYMQQHGDSAGGRKIEIIRRDDTGPAPNVVKRLARELVVNDHVDVIAGLTFTPNALVTAPVATQAKIPAVIMNAATTSIVTKSPYMVRTSFTLPQLTAPLARWAAANGIKSVYTVVSDYGPGYDAEKAFIGAFTKAGGKIAGKVRIPLKNTDFSPYVQRIKDASPGAVFLFMPTGQPPVGFIRSFNELGLGKAGVKVLADGGAGDDSVIQLLGKDALGAVTATNYWPGLDNPANKAFVAAFHKLYGDKEEPNFYAADAYDGMAAIYAAANKTKGDLHGPAAIEAMKGLKLDGPRGQVEIDAKTRDIVQSVYIRRAEMVDGHIESVLIDTAKRIDHNGDPLGN
jgi:branched-chain amino acid transport system substrate-binding protein